MPICEYCFKFHGGKTYIYVDNFEVKMRICRKCEDILNPKQVLYCTQASFQIEVPCEVCKTTTFEGYTLSYPPDGFNLHICTKCYPIIKCNFDLKLKPESIPILADCK